MSNYLAVGTVTATLKRMLQERLDVEVPGAQATVDRPGTKAPGGPAVAGVNIFLYQVTPNAAFRAVDLPTRRGDGSLLARPTIGLDLHYLLSFFGDDSQLEPQRILGSVVCALHAQPVITDQMIEAIKTAAAPPLPAMPVFPELKETDLADQIDSITFVPAGLSLEELSKLWSVFFQTTYQLSMAYGASVVLIEDTAIPKPQRPVLRRGVAAEAMGNPVVDQVTSVPDPTAPITLASTISIKGRDMLGDGALVRLSGVDVVPALATSIELRLALTTVSPASLRAGEQPIQVVRETLVGDPPTMHRSAISKMTTLMLHPRVQNATVVGNAVRVALDLTVGARQSVALLILDVGTGVQRFLFAGPERIGDAATVEVPIAGVPSGTYLVQMLVDGAESPLTTDAGGAPTGPTLVVP